MKFGSLFLSSAVVLNVLALPVSHGFCERGARSGGFIEPSVKMGSDPNIVTLYRPDPIGHSFNVIRKAYGDGFDSDGNVLNYRSNLRIYWAGGNEGRLSTSLVTGVKGNSRGAIVDLGTVQEMNARYKNSVPKNNWMLLPDWFTTLQVSGKRVFAQLRNGESYTPIPIPEASKLFPSTSTNFFSAPAKVGHVYLLREFTPGYQDVVFKALVLAMTEDSITIRFALMRNEEPSAKPTPTPEASAE